MLPPSTAGASLVVLLKGIEGWNTPSRSAVELAWPGFHYVSWSLWTVTVAQTFLDLDCEEAGRALGRMSLRRDSSGVLLVTRLEVCALGGRPQGQGPLHGIV